MRPLSRVKPGLISVPEERISLTPDRVSLTELSGTVMMAGPAAEAARLAMPGPGNPAGFHDR